MKNSKKLLSFSLLILSIHTCFAQADFKSLNWGISKGEVKVAEKCPIISEEDNKINYDCTLFSTKSSLIYTFTESDKLLRAKYLMAPEYYNMTFFVQDYKMLQELLTEKYGKALSTLIISSSKDSVPENQLASYLALGNLRMETKWDLGKTTILLTLSKVKDKPIIQIDYISKAITVIDIKEKKEKLVKGL